MGDSLLFETPFIASAFLLLLPLLGAEFTLIPVVLLDNQLFSFHSNFKKMDNKILQSKEAAYLSSEGMPTR